jgi:hypothetical protein
MSPFDAQHTRRLIEAGKLSAVKVGCAWYGRPSDVEALFSTAEARAPANDHDRKSGADRILQDELARLGLRLCKAAPLPLHPSHAPLARSPRVQRDHVRPAFSLLPFVQSKRSPCTLPHARCRARLRKRPAHCELTYGVGRVLLVLRTPRQPDFR